MKNQIRSCSNCQYFDAGTCSAPMPSSFVGISFRRKVKATAGAECPAHRFKAVRQRKLVLVQGEAA